jgi:hypothetical protein
MNKAEAEWQIWNIPLGHSIEFPWQWGLKGIKKRIKQQHAKDGRRYEVVKTILGYHNLIRRIK